MSINNLISTPLIYVKEKNDLGIIFDAELNFRSHINAINNKVMNILGFVLWILHLIVKVIIVYGIYITLKWVNK